MFTTEHETPDVWSTKTKEIKIKISLSDKYAEKRYLLSSFLTQIKTYIRFNCKIFNSETEKIMFTVMHL